MNFSYIVVLLRAAPAFLLYESLIRHQNAAADIRAQPIRLPAPDGPGPDSQ
jgi:hypothetical protein